MFDRSWLAIFEHIRPFRRSGDFGRESGRSAFVREGIGFGRTDPPFGHVAVSIETAIIENDRDVLRCNPRIRFEFGDFFKCSAATFFAGELDLRSLRPFAVIARSWPGDIGPLDVGFLAEHRLPYLLRCCVDHNLEAECFYGSPPSGSHSSRAYRSRERWRFFDKPIRYCQQVGIPFTGHRNAHTPQIKEHSRRR